MLAVPFFVVKMVLCDNVEINIGALLAM